ncbi:Scr1 family TA system antitoxin-like transcriptional regulator [Kitasatospora sp. NPDC001132]
MRGRKVRPQEIEITPSIWAWLLRDHRVRAGFNSCAELAREVGYHPSYVTRVEALDRAPALQFAEACDKALRANGRFTDTWNRVDWTTIDHPEWFRSLVAREQEAVRIRQLQTERVPGLLQTAPYARALFRYVLQPDADEDEIERKVAARLRRRTRFLAAGGPELVAIVDEAVIWQHVGGPLVMREQLEYLLSLPEHHPNIHVHIAQRELGEKTGAGSFHLLSLPNGETWSYAESRDGGHFVTDPGIVERRSQAYDRLRGAALNWTDSANRIRRAARELVNVTTTPSLTVDWRRREWKKSSFSQGNGGDCIEVAMAAQAEGIVPVRDSKDKSGPVLGISPAGWSAFVAGVRNGDFGDV